MSHFMMEFDPKVIWADKEDADDIVLKIDDKVTASLVFAATSMTTYTNPAAELEWTSPLTGQEEVLSCADKKAAADKAKKEADSGDAEATSGASGLVGGSVVPLVAALAMALTLLR